MLWFTVVTVVLTLALAYAIQRRLLAEERARYAGGLRCLEDVARAARNAQAAMDTFAAALRAFAGSPHA